MVAYALPSAGAWGGTEGYVWGLQAFGGGFSGGLILERQRSSVLAGRKGKAPTCMRTITEFVVSMQPV